MINIHASTQTYPTEISRTMANTMLIVTTYKREMQVPHESQSN